MPRFPNPGNCATASVIPPLEVSSRLPDDFISLWHSGEEGGRLEDSLERLTRNYADSAELRFQELARWVPRGVYAVIAVFLVYSIFKIATEVFSHYPVP